MHRDTILDCLRYRWIAFLGKKVQKSARRPLISPKPFKSGKKVNTVKGVIRHPRLGHLCYTFKEDDSYVECWRCKVVQ